MIQLDRLLFSEIKDRRPERWESGEPGNAIVRPHDEIDGRYAVRRQGEEFHEVALARVNDEFAGACDCDGYEYHDGPCSHLIAVYRLLSLRDDDFHKVRPESYGVELRRDAEQRAATDAEPENRVSTDGGRRL